MSKTGQLFIHVASPAGVTAQIFSHNDEEALRGVLTYAMYHFNRDPGWFKVAVSGTQFFSCRTITLPFLYFLDHRIATPQAKAFFTRAMKHISLASGAADPDVWIAVHEDIFIPFPSPGENQAEADKLIRSLTGAFNVDGIDPAPAQQQSRGPVSSKEGEVMQRFYQGWSVADIAENTGCSKSYVYKLLREEKGISASDLRWQRWKMIAEMYFASPRKTLREIEQISNVSRTQIYHAVKMVSGREDTERRNRKLLARDIELIQEKLSQGALRKDVCDEYHISLDTLIKYMGKNDDHHIIPESVKQDIVRLRVQGKTIQQTADILSVSTDSVKKVWRQAKQSPETENLKVKYDNRNPLSKHDRDQAVNAVLAGGHTRKQICKQYGINALTLRRYIRIAQNKETAELNICDIQPVSNKNKK
ncbi:helix-turn-helix domain-containing protein [Pantoea sp. App145]|uniref:helix-turn-helix domain-containing protein n=1 Tax=Pantoea sp. App145 TaxID=3071567 RepID=UPI003A80074C